MPILFSNVNKCSDRQPMSKPLLNITLGRNVGNLTGYETPAMRINMKHSTDTTRVTIKSFKSYLSKKLKLFKLSIQLGEGG